ncbi:hypothetical protein CHS0354_028061 [Potamilus streckersoni]|uniref:Peflin n=1 Tax=Potamilus streckersoni TaxID=2493646 RepID=A0AAE0TI67_9BIVA|nr:hypothetical protein CHS0354_028061 [Potamilus streckersoni]
MSWGGQPNQQYGGYGAPQGYQSGGPEMHSYQQRPENYGGYGQNLPPGGQVYGQHPSSSYGHQGPAMGQQYGQSQQQYGGYQQPPPYTGSHSGYGQPGGYGGFGGPSPPPGVSTELWQWFQSVDQDRSGKITAEELQQALMNGNWSPFNPETCRLMIGMFDRDRSGTIDVIEFAALWKYIQDWKACFDRFDTDRSGNIDAGELNTAFRSFGYNLSPQFCDLIVRVFDRRGGRNIKFDDFIQACVMLKTLTDKFRVKDVQQNGMIRITYEEFLEMVLDTTLVSTQ